MARLRLLKPWNNQLPGDVINVPGGTASILLRDRVAELDREGEAPTNSAVFDPSTSVVTEPHPVEVDDPTPTPTPEPEVPPAPKAKRTSRKK